jgi:membrane protein
VSSSRGLVSALPGGLTLLIELLEFSLLAAGMALLFRFMPNTHVRWRHAWAGAVFVALGFEVAKRALAWYVKSVPGYAMVYGAFATLPIFLLWIYLSWLIVLFGAVIAAYAPSLALHVVRRPDRPGERFALAVAVLQALQVARGADERGLSAEALAGRLRTDPLQVAPVLDDLLAPGLVRPLPVSRRSPTPREEIARAVRWPRTRWSSSAARPARARPPSCPRSRWNWAAAWAPVAMA